MKSTFTRTLGMLALAASLSPLASCNGDLDQQPSYAATTDVIYRDPAQIQQVLARLYATFAISGQQGPAGQPDISGIDEGFSNYLRQYWQLQEITTDEAVLGWNDGNLPSVNTLQWNADNEFVRATYDRIYYEIGLCNEFIRQTSDARLSERGIGESDAQNIRVYRAEARLLRALSYWHAVDLFGNGPFATENTAIGENPPYATRAQLFAYVESELKALSAQKILLRPRQVYGRADRAVCWTVLAKLYLNAGVYTGTDRSNLAVTYADSVMQSGNGYALCQTSTPTATAYQKVFLADNGSTDARNEIIFPITFDGLRTKTFGGMTYLVHAPVGRGVSPGSAGINGGWAGLRAKDNLRDLLRATPSSDTRQALIVSRGQNPNVDTLGVFSSGVLITKYRNITSAGAEGSDGKTKGGAGDFPDNDFPMFRLADVMLMKAEALLRSNGDASQALSLVNDVRRRSGAPDLTSISLPQMLEERGRELFWEGHRRTDLIRFGRYTTGYNWPFKGGVRTGTDVAPTRAIFPIPATDIVANPNLTGRQNTGY